MPTTPPARITPRRAHRRAFTLLELMLALALASVVIASAMGVLWMVVDTDRRLDERFNEQVELTTAQIMIRRSMASLVASPPIKPGSKGPKASGAPDSATPSDRTEADDPSKDRDKGATKEEDPLKLHAEEAGASPELIAELFETRFQGRPNFELYFDTDAGPEPVQRLEIVVMESPVPPPVVPDSSQPSEREIAGFLPIRGAFALRMQDDGFYYSLVWQPLLPAGPPTVLIRDLYQVEWSALPTKEEGAEWVPVQAAVIQETYPVAVRLALWTARGTHVDWLFETGISTPGAPTAGGGP